jgi:microcystin degradation protein MlrC
VLLPGDLAAMVEPSMERRRILVGRFWHEGHSFNPIPTMREDFALTYGDAILDEARSSATALSGIVRSADQLGYQLVPVISAWARPGGAIDQEFFDEVMTTFANAAGTGGFDAIAIELHGATTAHDTIDTEGALLTALRLAVGPEMPIAVALDLHGYITPAMVTAATIMTGYRTNPHADMVETGMRAMQLLHSIMMGTIQPRASIVTVPFLTRGNDETSAGPLVEICKRADAWRTRVGMIDLSLFNVHPFIDAPSMGQVVLAYGEATGIAQAACNDIAQRLWQARDAFMEILPDIHGALTHATSSDRPLVLGDQGDRVLGAGPGDSVEIARIAMKHYPELRLAAPVYDPDIVIAAHRAGIGAVLHLPVGGGTTSILKPLIAHWHVVRIMEARFINRGPYMAGIEAYLGMAAVLQAGNVMLIATTRAPNVHDPAFFETMGIPVSGQQVLVAKSGNHYKLSFADCATAITVNSPGLTAFRPHDLPFQLARPIYPCDDIAWTLDR